MSRRGFATLAVGALLSHCGEPPEYAVVDVTLVGYTVPAEVDAIHLQLVDGTTVVGERTLALDRNETRLTLTLERGDATPREVTLLAVAGKEDGVVDLAEPAGVRFAASAPRTAVVITR